MLLLLPLFSYHHTGSGGFYANERPCVLINIITFTYCRNVAFAHLSALLFPTGAKVSKKPRRQNVSQLSLLAQLRLFEVAAATCYQ